MAEDRKNLSRIKMLVLDVDGVLTDCRIFMDTSGEWRRFFSIRDGVGIKQLIENGYKVAIITASKSRDIQDRAKILGIHYFYEGSLDKSPALMDLQAKSGIETTDMAYMGDDYFDIPILKKVGFAATVPDAMDEVFENVNYITKRPAGNGAVREVCDLILRYGFYSSEREAST